MARSRASGFIGVIGALLAAVGSASTLSDGIAGSHGLEPLLERPGSALRAAVHAMERGEALLADALLIAVGERYAIIADHADLLRLQLRIEAGRYQEAIALQERWSYADSPLASEFYTLLGRAYAAEGEDERAREAWEFAAHAEQSRDRRAALRLVIAESVLRSGDLQSSADAYLSLWSRHPGTPEAAEAETNLARIEREMGHSVRDAESHRVRADALYKLRYNEDALAEYDQALALGLSGSQRVDAQDNRAQTLFRLRRYSEASEAFKALPPTEPRRIQYARALARSGRVPSGARTLEEIGAGSKSKDAARALLLAALLWDGEGEGERANGLYAYLLKRSPRSSYANAARWRLGWSAFREQQYTLAIDYFEIVEKDEPDAVAALRPRYWSIRSSEKLGDPTAAERYADLALEFPLSYYGWRASGRVERDASPRVIAEMRPGRTALTARQLERPRILIEAGLVDRARAELDSLSRRARGVDDRLALAQLFADVGDFYSSQRLMVDAYTESLARGPIPERLELWWHAWPAPFEEEMRGATLEGLKVEPGLVYAIMREESGYRPKIVSVSGARGLLQLMPETAERVARESQLDDFSPDDLFEPGVNIQLGSDYLSTLLRRFDGRTSAAIGSYNAGPQAVARWVNDGPVEDDIWVEEIPYDQTRGYVKRVLRSLHAYRVLY